jgi:O-antigen ligase
VGDHASVSANVGYPSVPLPGSPALRAPHASQWVRPLLYLTGVAGAAATVAGHFGPSRPMTIVGALAVVGCAGILAPELALALLIMIAGIKGAPFLSSLPVDATVITAAAVLLSAAARAWGRGLRPFPTPAVFALLLAALIVASVIWSPDPSGGLSEATRFETLTLAALFAPFAIVRDERDLARLMAGLVIFSLVVVLLSVPTGDVNQPLSVVGTQSGGEIELASDCAMGFFAAIYLALRGSGTARLLAVGAALILGKTMVAAGSRGIIAGTLLAVVYLAFVTRRSWMRGRQLWLVIAGVVALAIILPLIAGAGLVRYQTQLFTGNTSAVLGQRAYIFKIARDLAIEHPFGLGAGGFQKVTGLVYPHNIELHLAVNFGLPAVGLFVILLIASWLARRRALAYGWRAESIILGVLMIIMVTDSQVSNGLNNPPSRSMWLILGLSLMLPRLAQAAPRTAADRGTPRGSEASVPV